MSGMGSMSRQLRILVVCASPRAHGVSARYAEALACELAGADADAPAAVEVWKLAEHEVAGCTGCEACRPEPGEHAREARACVIDDGMAHFRALLDAADEVHVVSPVYFSGPPAQFKCVLDRLQPYWELRCGPHATPEARRAPKRPVVLHVMGVGGDPFGFDALERCVRSAFGAAGFSVVEVRDCIGWGQPGASEPPEPPAPPEQPEQPEGASGSEGR